MHRITGNANLASMNIQEMEYNVNKAASLLTMMSNPKRLLILCQLLGGERSVMELAKAVGLSQSALSQHLAKLRGGKLVATRRDAQTIYYSLASENVEAIMNVLYDIYCSGKSEAPHGQEIPARAIGLDQEGLDQEGLDQEGLDQEGLDQER